MQHWSPLHNTVFDQFCSQTRPFHRDGLQVSPQSQVSNCLCTGHNFTCMYTDMCKEYILYIPVIFLVRFLRGGGGGGGVYKTHMQKQTAVTSKSDGVKKDVL